MNADGTRRFRYAYIEISRKNGKTMLSASTGLLMLFADGESRPEVYSAATVKDQAKLCFSDAVAIVKATDLKNYLTPYRNSISYELKGGTWVLPTKRKPTTNCISPRIWSPWA